MESGRVYFIVLTTTGLGDYTAATAVGRALGVVEMLVGQLYLVMVIGMLIGSIATGVRGARATRPRHPDHRLRHPHRADLVRVLKRAARCSPTAPTGGVHPI